MTTPRTPTLTPRYVAQTLGTYLPGLLSGTEGEEAARLDQPFSSITSDSRKVKPGCLFVALKGEKFDGHQFIEAACSQGAAGVICRTGSSSSLFKSVHVFEVEDTLDAYRSLAGAWRSGFDLPLVGVAGSVGKTTTKELLAALLMGRWSRVLKTEGSQNGYIGIPMTLLDLTSEHSAAVIEIGIDEIGAMVRHMDLVRPTSAILTAIGPEHLEKLIDLETVAREEAIALQHTAQRSGQVIVNLDDPWIAPLLTGLIASAQAGTRIVCFSLADSPAPSGVDVIRGSVSPDGETLSVTGLGMQEAAFKLPLPGAHNAQNLMAALAVARSMDLDEQELRAGLSQFKGAYGRSEVRSWRDAPILCDYYNANPSSVEAGLEVLTQLSKKGRESSPRKRWACLADMLELGVDEEKLHRGLASRICALGIENVLLYGTRMKWLAAELERCRYNSEFSGTIAHHPDQKTLAMDLISRAGKEDAVMIKGSRGMRMEEVWKILESHSS